MDEIKGVILKFREFRKAMGLDLSLDMVRYIWGRKETKRLQESGMSFGKNIDNLNVE